MKPAFLTAALSACLLASPTLTQAEQTPAAGKEPPPATAPAATPTGAATPEKPAGEEGQRSDAEVSTRAYALEVAGAFSNEGFKIRDGHWLGRISRDKPRIIQVNLYAGNQYWFVATASPEAERIVIALFDEKGKPVEYEPYADHRQSAAGFSPEVSGPYYVRVEETEGEPATFCLLYTYK